MVSSRATLLQNVFSFIVTKLYILTDVLLIHYTIKKEQVLKGNNLVILRYNFMKNL
jgi:hypothetical protein